MIKVITAYTKEIDDAGAAVSDILGQLELDRALRKNSIGLLTCHADFISGGGYQAVCEALPFEIVGTTTLGASTEAATDLEILTLSVLTSDDVEFAPVLTASLQSEQEGAIGAACAQGLKKLGERPSLVLAYAPLLANVGGERLVRILDKALDGAPLFGTLTCDHNFDFRESQILFNGEAYRDRLALIMMSGPVNCSFLTVSVPESKAEKQSAIITESEGNVVKKVNDLPLLNYLESIGLGGDAGLDGSKYIPVILDYRDGTQAVARCFYMISPEGYAVCGGDMPVGATFALSSMEPEDVVTSAEEILDKALDSGKLSGMLFMPCIVRSITLGVDQLAEARRVAEKVAGNAPYQLCYSGGEICPVYQADGETANRFHNFSFAVCMFRE